MSLFDSYVVVDWSARSTPARGTDSIWIAVADRDDPPRLSNPGTRGSAERAIADAIDERSGVRTLVAIDVALGYPDGSVAWFGLADPAVPPWQAMWVAVERRIVDDARNRNNRFEVAAELNARRPTSPGPFWGCPRAVADHRLASTKPARPVLAEFRLTERRLRLDGWRPKSVWQLLGAGSVGGQTLTALPMLQRLVASRSGRVAVWPFTAGAIVPCTVPGSVVVAEVWPSQFLRRPRPGRVRDAAQVDATAAALRDADRSGALRRWFAPELRSSERTAVEREEGWVLGPVVASAPRSAELEPEQLRVASACHASRSVDPGATSCATACSG